MSDRTYEVDGKDYTSVTTFLSVVRLQYLERWRGEIGNRAADTVMDQTSEIGTALHEMSAVVDRGELLPLLPDGLAPMLSAYEKWVERAVVRFVYIERVVVSEKYGFAGRLDRLAQMKGDPEDSLTLVDLKTSNQVTKLAAMQTAAYQQALTEEGLFVPRRLVVRIDRLFNDEPEVVELEDHNKDLNAFFAAMVMYRYLSS